MQLEEKILFCLIALLGMASLASITIGQQPYDIKVGPINASILQPISINVSNELAEGILFTNGSTIGVQYPITNVHIENNATRNYNGTSFGTLYSVGSSIGNSINITIGFTPCDDLRNATFNAYIRLNYTSGGEDGPEGGFFKNSTTSATDSNLNLDTPTQDYAFKVREWVIVGSRVSPGQNLYLRFWLDPWPNNVPSGIYNTTYRIKAVEYNTSLGDVGC
jgi:hypothetical protein